MILVAPADFPLALVIAADKQADKTFIISDSYWEPLILEALSQCSMYSKFLEWPFGGLTSLFSMEAYWSFDDMEFRRSHYKVI